jgi:hypothetical protein
MLRDYLAQLAEVRAELQTVRDSLRTADGIGQRFRHPSYVADWGLDYFDSEREITERLLSRLEDADQ